MALTPYELGEVAQLDFTVRTITNTLVDPTGLTAEARKPSGFVDDITDLITTSGTGTYQVLLPLDQAGDWNVEIVTVDPDDTQRFALYVAADTVEASTLDDTALTTLSRARMHVLRNVTQTDQDELLAFYINASSQAIVNYINREPKPTDSATRTLNYDGEGVLSLDPWEIRTVDSVTVLAEGTTVPQTITTSGFRLEPAQRTREGTYLSLRLPDSYACYWDGWGHEVTIVGDWGMEAVPKDIEMACLVAVADAFRNPGSFTSYSTAGGFTAGEPLAGPAGSLPIGARRLLYPYRRQRRVGSVRLGRRYETRRGGGLPVL